MNEFKYFLLATFLFVNHFGSSSGQETVDLKETAREVVAKITILENKLTTVPSKEMMRQVDVLFIELNEILEKFEGEDKELYTKIVAKLKEKFEKIKTQFKAYYDVYLTNVEIEKKMMELENILASLPQSNLYQIFSKVNESLKCVVDLELKLNDDFFHHKLDKSYYEIRRALEKLRKLDFLEKQIDSLDGSIAKLFTIYREMYYGEKSKLRNMGKLIETANAAQTPAQ